MKIGYFYPSSPEIEYPEIKTLAPSAGIMVVEADNFPKQMAIGLNFSLVGLSDGDQFSVHIEQYLKDIKQTNTITEYVPARANHYSSKSGEIVERYTVIEPVMAIEEGIYTFKMYLFDYHINGGVIDTSRSVSSAECSVLIARGWK